MTGSPLEPAIVKPIRSKYTPDIGSVAAMVATRPDIGMLRGMSSTGDEISRNLFTGKVYIAAGASSRFSMTGPLVGAPYAAMILETLIAWGARQFIFWGWCGAVSPEACIGDIILPSAAMIDEGTSRHYLATREEISRPSRAMTARIRGVLNTKDANWKEGLIWTTDGVFRETRKKVIYYQSRGVLAVEMEMSALFTVAEFHHVDIGGILVVSDDVSGLTWEPGFKSERFEAGRVAAGEAVQAVLKELS
jgi:purine-nucleoside phosphorylase